MAVDTLCRVCLADNMNLYRVRSDLLNVYERIAKEKYNKVGYPEHMCYICLMVLRKCHRFMETARDTNDMLKQWHNQQNEVRLSRPLYTYSINKAELVSICSGNMTLQNDIKVEIVKSEQEAQSEYIERNTDVDMDKTDIDEQTDNSEVSVDSPDDTDTGTDEDNNDRETDPLFVGKIDIDEKYIKHENISPLDDDVPRVKKRKLNETKPKHQVPATSRVTAVNSETSNDIPSQPDNIRHRNAKTEPTFDKNNYSSKGPAEFKEDVETNVVRNKDRTKRNNVKDNRDLNKASIVDEDEISTFDYESTLQEHSIRNTNSNVDKPFSCDICNYKCKQKADLKKHIRTHPGYKPYRCNICGHEFSQTSYLKLHMRNHTGERPFSCDLCDYKGTSNSSLKSHMKKHTGEKPFSCDVCDIKFSQKGALKLHMRIHTGEKPFACDICGYKFNLKHHLIRHVKIHTGEKPFTCNVCGHKFIQKGQFKIHMANHTGEKPFSCEVCGFKFALKSYLNSHMKIHSGEKPISCDFCDYKCAQKSNLKVHMRRHTGEKPYSCSICGHKCSRKDDLKKHMSRHTIDERDTLR